MAFHPFEVNAPHLAYTLLGGFTVLFGLFSLFVKERLYLGEAPIATIVGIIIGPYALNFFDPYEWGGSSTAVTDEITLEVTRVVIAIGVFAVGVELPKAYMKKHWRSLFFLLGPCMVYGWMISALLIWGLIPGLTFLSSLVIAACVTPTDPILAQAVVGGKFADKHVPAHIRHLLSAESGSNDGAAFPFLYIALYLTLDSDDGHAVGEWFYITWLYEVALGIVLGSLLGFSARKVMKFVERKRLVDRQSFVAQYVSLAILAIGMCTLLGSDDLLAAFACGTAFAWDGFFNRQTEDAVFSNVIDLLFNCAAFIYIGAIIPFHSFADASIHLSVWRLVVLAILILLIRRLPAILALYKLIPDIKTLREAAFTGWFGPMGVGAIFISTLARTQLPEPADTDNLDQVGLLYETIGPIVAFLVLSSVLTHGLSIPFFSLSRRVHSITYTWSRNPSMDARGDEPAWTTHARRITPGQSIRINRDDDEEGDLGLQRHRSSTGGEKAKLSTATEGSSGSASRSASGSGSASRRDASPPTQDEYEMSESRERAGDVTGGSRDDLGEGVDEDEAAVDGGEAGNNDGRRTPPLAEYREGNHLIIERRAGTDEEVEVEVIRNHFHQEKPSESSRFHHPHPLKHHEVDKLTDNVNKSLEHAKSSVEEGGRHAIDRLGLGLMRLNSSASDRARTPSPTRSRSRSRSPSPSPPPQDQPASDRTLRLERTRHIDSDGEESDDDGFIHRRPSGDSESRDQPSRLGDVHTSIPASRIHGYRPRKPAGWRRFVPGLRSGTPEPPAPGRAEEGISQLDNTPSIPIVLTPSRQAQSPGAMSPINEDRSLQLTRTQSARAIRFAPEAAGSSDTAPGMANYGNANPSFRRTPGLAIPRTTSVQSSSSARDGLAVRIVEPEIRR